MCWLYLRLKITQINNINKVKLRSLLMSSVLNRGDGASHVLLAEAISKLCSLKRLHLLNHILIHTLSVKFGLIAFFVILNEKLKRLRIKLDSRAGSGK